MAYNAPLRRSRDNRMIGGVVSGLANYFGLDISLARIIYVVGSICSAAFPGLLVYLLMWIVIPEEEYHRTYEHQPEPPRQANGPNGG